jgi:hypothetical protein
LYQAVKHKKGSQFATLLLPLPDLNGGPHD